MGNRTRCRRRYTVLEGTRKEKYESLTSPRPGLANAGQAPAYPVITGTRSQAPKGYNNKRAEFVTARKKREAVNSSIRYTLLGLLEHAYDMASGHHWQKHAVPDRAGSLAVIIPRPQLRSHGVSQYPCGVYLMAAYRG